MVLCHSDKPCISPKLAIDHFLEALEPGLFTLADVLSIGTAQLNHMAGFGLIKDDVSASRLRLSGVFLGVTEFFISLEGNCHLIPKRYDF